MTTLVHRTTCAFCGHHHDRITTVEDEDERPCDGDASMCWSCGQFNIVAGNVDGGLRRPTKREQRDLDGDKRIRDIRETWRMVTARRQ
jgi:hypothetical protein